MNKWYSARRAVNRRNPTRLETSTSLEVRTRSSLITESGQLSLGDISRGEVPSYFMNTLIYENLNHLRITFHMASLNRSSEFWSLCSSWVSDSSNLTSVSLPPLVEVGSLCPSWVSDSSNLASVSLPPLAPSSCLFTVISREDHMN